MRTVGSWIGSAISALVTPSVLPKAGDGGAPGSFSYLAGLTASFFSKRFVQEKLDVGLVPDTLVVRKLPGGGNIFAGQPNGYRQKLLRPLGFSQDVIQGDRLALTHGKAQVRLDLRPMLIPPGRFFSFVVEGRNNQFLPGHDGYTPLSVKYSFLVRRSASPLRAQHENAAEGQVIRFGLFDRTVTVPGHYEQGHGMSPPSQWRRTILLAARAWPYRKRQSLTRN